MYLREYIELNMNESGNSAFYDEIQDEWSILNTKLPSN